MKSWKPLTAVAILCTPLLAAASHTASDIDPQDRYSARFDAYYDSGANEVYWYHSFRGDCDQNGVVNISDLSRLGAYLGSSVGAGDVDKAMAAADCDGNGEVNINDISAMGPNLNKQLTGYRIWVRPDFAPDYPFDSDVVEPAQDAIQNYSDAVGVPVNDHLRYNIDTTSFEHQWLWVQEQLADGPGRLSKLKMSDNTTNTSIMTYDPNWGLSWNPGTSTLTFYHTMRGDYDQNGLIGVTELTPIFANMGEIGPWSIADEEWVLDGNRDQAITSADTVLIEMMFGQSIWTPPAGYNVYYLPDIADQPPHYAPDLGIFAAHVNVEQGIKLGNRRSYAVQLTGAAAQSSNYLWVRPITSAGGLGARSEIIDTP